MRVGFFFMVLFAALSARADMTNLMPTASPGLRRSTGIAAQPLGSSDRLWIFGGYVSQGNGSEVSETWRYDTAANTWSQLTPTATPQGTRERHGLAYEPTQSRVVLFGGMRKASPFSVTYFNDVYGYDPTNNVWELYTASGTAPSTRCDASFVWAPDRNAFLVFGGSQDALGLGGSRFNDLYELKISAAAKTATWTKLTPSGTPPGVRGAACAAYDSTANRLLIFGGEVSNATMVADQYEWDSATNAWSQPTNVTNVPSARGFAACIWEPVEQKLLLYGGENGNPLPGGAFYDPPTAQWTPLNFTPNPGARTDAAGTYSPALGGMVFFGGRSGATTYVNETWLTVISGLSSLDGGSGDGGTDGGSFGSDGGTADGGVDGGAPDGGGGDGGGTDAGELDGGAADGGDLDGGTDAGDLDGGAPDAGELDGGFGDAGQLDAGSHDAGLNDAGSQDGGDDPADPLHYGVGCASDMGLLNPLLVVAALLAVGFVRRRKRA